MSKTNQAAALLATTLFFATTTFADDDGTSVKEVDVGKYLPKCSAPVAAITIGTFSCKAQSCAKPNPAQANNPLAGMMAMAAMAQGGAVLMDFSTIGDGMSNALTTALKATNCFDVQEREAMAEIQKEMELAGVKVQAKPADYLIMGAITSVGIQTERSSFGGGFIPVIGAITHKTETANLAMDVRIVDIKKADVLASKSFEADSKSSSTGVMGGGLVGAGGLFGGYSVSKSPEMDKIATQTVIYTVNYLVDTLAKNAVVSRPTLSIEEKKPEEQKSAASQTSNPVIP